MFSVRQSLEGPTADRLAFMFPVTTSDAILSFPKFASEQVELTSNMIYIVNKLKVQTLCNFSYLCNRNMLHDWS